MKKLRSVSLLALLLNMAAVAGLAQSSSADRGHDTDIRNRFIGAWRLAWLQQPGRDGQLHRIDCCGMFVFTRDGHASVQVLERNSQPQASAGPQQYSQGGYEASYGSYEIDENAHTFTFHVEGALVKTLIGQDLQRAYEFSGNQLIVKSTRPDEHWRVVWERY